MPSTKDRYLDVTFRKGNPFAAYLYLPRESNDASARVERYEHGLLVDRTADGRAIGVEISDPRHVTLTGINHVLTELSQEPLSAADIAPLGAA